MKMLDYGKLPPKGVITVPGVTSEEFIKKIAAKWRLERSKDRSVIVLSIRSGKLVGVKR